MKVMSLRSVLMRDAVYLFFVLWQAPQWVVGALTAGLLRIMGRVVSRDRRVFTSDCGLLRLRVYRMVTRKRRIYGWSLADWIFIRSLPVEILGAGGVETLERVARHEAGHSRQSLALGWLYLPVIALPSLIVTGISPQLAKRCYFEKFLMGSDA